MFPNCPISKHSFFLMFMTYLWNSIIFLLYSWGRFCTIVVLVCIHRPFLLINLSHHKVVPANSVTDISMASLLASTKIIFVETAIPFFLWSIIQFLTYFSSFGNLGAHERKVFLLLSALIKSFLCYLHSRIIFSVGGEPKCLSAARFPCSSA